MAQAARLSHRMHKELKLLLSDPPPGASFPFLSPVDGDDASSSSPACSSLSVIDALIEGSEDTVYAGGVFNLRIQIPERYPFQPPIVTFATPIYHPNIDNGGRICLDILNLPPKGAWQPSLNISTVITSIGLLLSEPNPDDGLMCEASKEFKYNRQAFDLKARTMTERYAKPSSRTATGSSQCTLSTQNMSSIDHQEVSCKSKHEDSKSFVCQDELLWEKLCPELSSIPSVARRDGDEEVKYKLANTQSTILGTEDGKQACNLVKRTGDDLIQGHCKPFMPRKKLSLKCSEEPQRRDNANKNTHMAPQVPSSCLSGPAEIPAASSQHIHPFSSLEACTANANFKRSTTERKLSLGLSTLNLPQNHGGDEKENLNPANTSILESHKGSIHLSSFTINEEIDDLKPKTRRCRLDLSVTNGAGDILQDQGRVVDPSRDLSLTGHKLSSSLMPLQLCRENYQFNECREEVVVKKQEVEASESAASASVIVLDSEESDEEMSKSRRSRLSLSSKRFARNGTANVKTC